MSRKPVLVTEELATGIHFERPVKHLVKALQDLLVEYPEAYLEYDFALERNLRFLNTRPETSEERRERVRKAMARDDYERKEYERLKKKFEPVSATRDEAARNRFAKYTNGSD